MTHYADITLYRSRRGRILSAHVRCHLETGGFRGLGESHGWHFRRLRSGAWVRIPRMMLGPLDKVGRLVVEVEKQEVGCG